ncbi:SDR family oxidoreductase [Tolumonas osonensis]|uniref:Short-subunit dehydrogenase n=1 Tax=Tolumonas osonensis TaxID=675874 RepID=A0A841GMX9_9GAMM|nr:SDR family oxidoreductase [Tolumonas osonensis]MBB6056110.1 short-subunit dehydrogenase [Tolumonas osonensis]
MKLENAKILITGASGGIGKALSHALAEQNAFLVLHGRNESQLEQLKGSLPYPERHQIIVADLTQTADRAALLQHPALNAGIDVLINNAGTNEFAWLEDQTETQIERQLYVNVQAPVLLTKAMLPHLNKPALIMNIGSSLGSIGYPGYSVYCATKFAIRGFSEALNRELAGSGIKVLYFAPRATQTSINSDAVNEMNKELGTKSDTAESVAREVVTALQKEIKRRWLGWPEGLFVRINGLIPQLVDNAIIKQLPVIAKFARVGFQKGTH